MLASADLTPLYAALDELWRNAPEAVAGVTKTSTAFALERLALHHGLGIAYRGIHRGGNMGTPTSELLGPPRVLRRIERAPAASFAASLGAALVDYARTAGKRPQGLPALAPPPEPRYDRLTWGRRDGRA